MLTKGTQRHIIKTGNKNAYFDHYDFDVEKSELLRQKRGIGFEEIVDLIEQGKSFPATKNSNPKYPHQFIFEVDIKGYIYIVPFVVDGACAYLKTIYPSRKATKKRRRKNEKEKLN